MYVWCGLRKKQRSGWTGAIHEYLYWGGGENRRMERMREEETGRQTDRKEMSWTEPALQEES